ncbi:LysR family transcriptional regulator [soil metagenome]|jgi:DNA-binding transcriptional LysR family regulator
MNLQQLDHLLALIDTGSFSRAAERVHLTQPALSRSIQSLEEELGAPLIDRLGKRKELTPVGRLVALRARRIRLEVSELKRSATLLAALETGSVRLGLGPAPAAMLSVPLLRHMVDGYPRIRLQLFGGPPDLQLQALRARSADALVMHRRSIPPHDDLDIEFFPEMRLGFVCRQGHPLLASKKVGLSQLQEFPLAASGLGLSGEVVQQLDEHFGRPAHLTDAIQFQSEEPAWLIETVRNSDVIFLGVLEVARTQLDEGSVVELPLVPALKLRSQFAFVTLEGVSESAALKVVRGFCAGAMHDR